jgi:hypothetical protein
MGNAKHFAGERRDADSMIQSGFYALFGAETGVAVTARRARIEVRGASEEFVAFAASFQHFSTVESAFPGIEQAAFRAFQKRHGLTSSVGFGELARFADTLESLNLDSQLGLASCFADAVRFDLAVAYAEGLPARTAPSSLTLPGYVVTARGLSLQSFEHDVLALRSGVPADCVQKRAMSVAFVPRVEDGASMAVALSAPLEALVQRAVSGATLDELVEDAALFFDVDATRPGFREACLRALQGLYAQGVLHGRV